MTFYHLSLLGLAALGTFACSAGDRLAIRTCAWAGWAAMGLAMVTGLAGLVIGVVLMALMSVPMVCISAPLWLKTYRAASMISMILVLAALFALNGSGFCGSSARPLFDLTGTVPQPIERDVTTLLHSALAMLAVFAVLTLTALTEAVRTWRPQTVAEILPTSTAVIGMAVGIT